jgi:transcriptional regulator with XRE-family HTH domain
MVRDAKVAAAYGHRIRTLRESRAWTLSEVSRRAGITSAYLSEIERGIKDPSWRTKRDIEKALGVRFEAEPWDDLRELLSDEEIELLQLFRSLPRTARAAQLQFVRFSAGAEITKPG